MDLYGLVRVQDVHVVEGLLQDLLLIFISDVLVQGDVVEKDPHKGVKQPWAVCVDNGFKLKPAARGSVSFIPACLISFLLRVGMLHRGRSCS